MILSPTERVMNHWQEDLMFGYQFLNGCNPVLIQRCTKLPEKLPVTTEMVECSLERQLTLEQEVEVRPGWLEMMVQARGSAQMSVSHSIGQKPLAVDQYSLAPRPPSSRLVCWADGEINCSWHRWAFMKSVLSNVERGIEGDISP